MKTLLIIALMSSSALAATQIDCTGTNGAKVRLTKYNPTTNVNNKKKGWFDIFIDESLSSGYIGEVEDRIVSPEKSQTADILSDWDGNSGIKISMRKGFLKSSVGTSSKAFLKVNYDDHATDLVSHTLDCTVVAK